MSEELRDKAKAKELGSKSKHWIYQINGTDPNGWTKHELHEEMTARSAMVRIVTDIMTDALKAKKEIHLTVAIDHPSNKHPNGAPITVVGYDLTL